MKKILVLGLFSLLWIVSTGQTVIDTLKNAKAWQNTFVNLQWYGVTREGHQYAPGLNCNYNSDGSPALMQLVKVDLINGNTYYKNIDGMVSPGNAGTAIWTHTMDSLGNIYIGLNYPSRRILKVNFKDSIDIENIGNGFGDNVSLAYSMSLGTDSHIYFGASSGATYWSEFDPKADSFVHKYTHSIDDWNDYVQQIVGDSDYVYAQVGQRNNTIKLFAINKATNQVSELFHIPAASRFQLEVKADHHIYMSPGIIDTIVGTWWLHNGQAIKISTLRNAFPVNNRMDYYEVGDWGQPMARTFFDQYNSILYGDAICCYGNNHGWTPYTAYPIRSNRQPNTIKVVYFDKSDLSSIYYIGNYYGIFFKYNSITDSSVALGSTSYNIYSYVQKDDSTLLFGAYPNGTVLEWNKNKPWTSLTYNSSGTQNATSYTSNPRIVAEFRTHTPAQFHHAKFMAKIGSNYVVGGDVIRTGNTFSIGAMDSASYRYWGYDCNKIDRLSMTGLTTWNNLAVIATSNAYGGHAKIYYYNPDSLINTMVDSIDLGWNNYAAYLSIYVVGDTLIGSHASYEYYKINLKTKQLLLDTSYLYYASFQLEDGYIGMNTPARMPYAYMLKLPNWYAVSSFNHTIYDVSWDGYSMYRERGLYPLSGMNASKITTSSPFYVSPNPSKGTISVSMSGIYSIYSREGRLVFRGEIMAHEPLTIDWPGNGVYFIRNHKTGRTQRILIVK